MEVKVLKKKLAATMTLYPPSSSDSFSSSESESEANAVMLLDSGCWHTCDGFPGTVYVNLSHSLQYTVTIQLGNQWCLTITVFTIPDN